MIFLLHAKYIPAPGLDEILICSNTQQKYLPTPIDIVYEKNNLIIKPSRRKNKVK